MELSEFLESVKGIDRSISTREQYGMPTIELKTKRELVMRIFNTLDEANLIDTACMIYLKGLSVNAVSERLGKSARTVIRYRKRVLHKLEKEWKNINGKK